MSEIKKVNEKIAEGVTDGFKKIEDGVVGGYKKIENDVVGGYKKIEEGVVGVYKKVENKFVDTFLTHEGETVEEAKKRLTEEQSAREKAADPVGANNIVKASIEASKNSGRH